MFSRCSSLTSLDVSKFNTQNVTSMRIMFAGCNNLTSLNLSNFNTQNVEDMLAMFWNCIYNHRTTKTNQKYPSVNL